MRSAPDADGIVRVNRNAHVRFQPAIGRRLSHVETNGIRVSLFNISTEPPAIRSGWRWLGLAIVCGCVLGLAIGIGVETLRWW